MSVTVTKNRMGRKRKEVDESTYTGRFAVRLRKLREKAKLSVEELAEKSGVPKNSIYNWECAVSSPPVGILPELARGLGLKIKTILPDD